MRIQKCDICRKTIKDKSKQYYISERFMLGGYEICETCGQPLQKFLENNQLVKEK